MVMALGILIAAAWGGLVRLGWSWPPIQPELPASHGVLMVAGFFGTLISLERAVALGRLWAYLAPILCGAGGVLTTLGWLGGTGPVLMTFGSLGLLVLFAVVLRGHLAGYMVVMALGAAALLVGNLLWLGGWPVFRFVFWWAGFLVLTIAGERLELGRMVRQTLFSQVSFWTAAGLYLAGLLILLPAWDLGVRVSGIGLIGLGAWLLRYDIARRTIRRAGLTRFIAVCLLSGYIWLLVSGAISLAAGGVPAGPLYDAMLHAVFLGFVLAMIFGHAPIIFPAVLGVDIDYKPALYLPLILLHLSLAFRIGSDLLGSNPARLWGGFFNVFAVLFYLGLISPVGKKLSAST
jgi:hypothetical protein